MKHDDHAMTIILKILEVHSSVYSGYPWISIFGISILKNIEAMQSKWTSRRPRLPVSQLQAEAWR